jgi:hypothetical protein
VAIKMLGVNPYTYIRIKNPGHTDVFISGVRAPPGFYGIARDHSVRAIAGAQLDVDVRFLLGPGETRDLVIIDLRNQYKVPKDEPQRVYFFIYWRKPSSTWLPQFPVTIMTSTHDLDRMAAAADPDHAEQVR